jgi:hypothetical protein
MLGNEEMPNCERLGVEKGRMMASGVRMRDAMETAGDERQRRGIDGRSHNMREQGVGESIWLR